MQGKVERDEKVEEKSRQESAIYMRDREGAAKEIEAKKPQTAPKPVEEKMNPNSAQQERDEKSRAQNERAEKDEAERSNRDKDRTQGMSEKEWKAKLRESTHKLYWHGQSKPIIDHLLLKKKLDHQAEIAAAAQASAQAGGAKGGDASDEPAGLSEAEQKSVAGLLQNEHNWEVTPPAQGGQKLSSATVFELGDPQDAKEGRMGVTANLNDDPNVANLEAYDADVARHDTVREEEQSHLLELL
jgi:hypothetical protein